METRREWLATMGTGLMAAMVSPVPAPRSSDEGPRAGQGGGRTAGAPERLSLDDFQPKSALHVPEHRVERPRFPVIDFHTHLTWSGKSADGRADAEAITPIAPASDVLAVMDRKSVTRMVNLTGGRGAGLTDTIARFDARTRAAS